MLILAPLVYWSPSKDHDVLVRGREDLEKQLSEQKVAVEQQRKRYKEMEVCGVGVCVCEGGGVDKIRVGVCHKFANVL